MDLKRRLTLYLVGLIIGGGMAYWIYGERITNGAWLPEAKVKQRLRSTLIQASAHAEVQLAEWPAELATVRLAMDSATVDLSRSQRTEDSIFYRITTRVAGRPAELQVSVLRKFDVDTTATLVSLEPLH
ncbi:MAG: hypothetical protein R2815_14390 [Flavobacteriales bacterium]